MSYLTDIVFVTADQSDADTFAEIVHACYPELDVKPTENIGRADSQTIVFHIVLNWAQDCVAALQTQTWHSECLLWTKVESSEPSIDHFELPAPPRREHYAHYAPSDLSDLEQQAIAAGIITPLKDKP